MYFHYGNDLFFHIKVMTNMQDNVLNGHGNNITKKKNAKQKYF